MIKSHRRYNCRKREFPPSCEPVKFLWSKHSYTLRHITNNFLLPCAVKCSVESCSLNWNSLHFDLSQPLLLHSKRLVKKVKAAVMKLDTEGGDLMDTGNHVVIPSDYNGWFTRLNDPTTKCLPSTTLESVAEQNTDQVLVANSISCLCLTDNEQGKKQTERKQISSGEILQIKRTYETNSNSVPKSSPLSKYVVCTDEKEKEMYLPISQHGKFYKVNDKALESDGLFQIQNVIDGAGSFPFNIRHMIGDVPIFASEYSSYLRCYDLFEEETVVASTIDEELILLELQVLSPLKFYIALNEKTAKQNEYYSDAIQNCDTEGEDYMRSIKFSFTLTPESYSIGNSLQSFYDNDSFVESYYGSESDFGDEDAQSEFTIKWDPPDDTKNTKPEEKGSKDSMESETKDIEHVPDTEYTEHVPETAVIQQEHVTETKDKAHAPRTQVIRHIPKINDKVHFPESKDTGHVPRIFNCSINSMESNINHWNEEPDTV